jgi:hypothetical protein
MRAACGIDGEIDVLPSPLAIWVSCQLSSTVQMSSQAA